jgi:hypothetical protein
MLKKTAIIILFGATHFVLTVGIVPVARMLNSGNGFEYQALPALFRIIVGITRLLYFPIITLGLYSRQWFPGNWIYIPVFINSLLWGAGLYLFIFFYRKFRKRIAQ